MTPDPQPPSAGSSFASIVASQSGGPSSGTSTSAPDISEETPLDAPCESACEGSDMDMDEADYEHPDFARIRRRRAEVTNLDALDNNLEGMADELFPRRLGVPGDGPPDSTNTDTTWPADDLRVNRAIWPLFPSCACGSTNENGFRRARRFPR